mmetsp:Transcript_37991/g.88388  ORF Transcript_37991/g.88388 Transcript_37991/m.88388 type:complete len:251 (-) Transcript_37991:285-1037(-)
MVSTNFVFPRFRLRSIPNAIPILTKVARHTSSSTTSSLAKHVKSPVKWYLEKLDTHPLITKCTSSGIVAGSGNVLCQYIVHYYDHAKGNHGNDKKNSGNLTDAKSVPTFWDNYDSASTSRFVIIGVFLVGPVTHHWYRFVMARIPGVGIAPTIKRTVLDQIFFAPIFLPTFMSSLGILERRRMDDVLITVKDQYRKLLLANWAVWIPAMLFNFRYIPANLQVLFSNVVAFGWNVFLSYESSKWKYTHNEE